MDETAKNIGERWLELLEWSIAAEMRNMIDGSEGAYVACAVPRYPAASITESKQFEGRDFEDALTQAIAWAKAHPGNEYERDEALTPADGAGKGAI